jgi:pilus assembly protein CpaB
MSSSALKVAFGIIFLATILLAGYSLVATRNLSERAERAEQAAAKAEAAQRATPQTLAVVANRPLAGYKAISRDDVALVPMSVLPADYFSSVDEVVGRVPLVDVDAGAPVTHRYFKEGNLLAKVIPPGHQAIAIEINEVIAAGGFLKPGDNVDVLVYLRTGPGVSTPQSRVLLENARVLAYEERVIERPQGLKDDDSKTADSQRRRLRTAVIAVPDAETTRVLLGIGMGEVRLALRGQQTPTAEETEAETASGGLPLSERAKQALKDGKTPDKAITAEQLSQVKAPPAQSQKSAPKPETIEVLHGSSSEKVSQ